MESSDEYIYILINPSFKGQLKIGKTTNSPEQRAKELSSNTGVPTPFWVAYEEKVSDCSGAEKEIHAMLENQGYRVNDNREFFALPLKDAINIVNNVCARYECKENGSQSLSKIDQSTKSGDVLFLDALNEFFEPPNDQMEGGPTYCFYKFDDDNLILDLSEDIRAKLDQAYQLGYKPAKGWLLYEEAWSHYYGHRKTQDIDLFIAKILESLDYNFEGSYVFLAGLFHEVSLTEYTLTGTLQFCVHYDLPIYSLSNYLWRHHKERESPYLKREFLSRESIEKLSILDNSFSARWELGEKDYWNKISDNQYDFSLNIINSAASINILKKGVKSGLYRLCPTLIFYFRSICENSIVKKYDEYCDLHEIQKPYSDFRAIGQGSNIDQYREYCKSHPELELKHLNFDLALDFAKNNYRFKKEYSIIVNKYMKQVKQYFELYVQNMDQSFFFHEAVYEFLEFCRMFRVKLNNKVTFKGIKTKETEFLTEWDKYFFYEEEFKTVLKNSGICFPNDR